MHAVLRFAAPQSKISARPSFCNYASIYMLHHISYIIYNLLFRFTVYYNNAHYTRVRTHTQTIYARCRHIWPTRRPLHHNDSRYYPPEFIYRRRNYCHCSYYWKISILIPAVYFQSYTTWYLNYSCFGYIYLHINMYLPIYIYILLNVLITLNV